MDIETSKGKILIVDDMPENIKILGETLQDDYTIVFATRGKKALELIAGDQPDLVLLDIVMPEMDGYEVCSRLKADRQTEKIPIIFVTDMGTEDDETKGFELGAVDYITKPFKPALVKSRVKTHLAMKSHHDRLERMVKNSRNVEVEVKNFNRKLEERIADQTEKLIDAQNEIVRKEYKNEMADLTSGTLHNVKNLLVSVKTSSEFISQMAVGDSIASLKKVNKIIRDNFHNIEDFICNNPKGRKCLEYYLKLEEMFDNEADISKKHQHRLSVKLTAIEEIIITQQAYSKGKSLGELVNIIEIIEDVLTMQKSTLENYNVNVIKEFNNLPDVNLHKMKLLHILINLIKNAKEALEEQSVDERNIKVSTSADDTSVFIKISDNGYGITSENMKKLFSHGFTTKETGNGYGLASSASYMEEMNGKIRAESDGAGKGTTFILEFPATSS